VLIPCVMAAQDIFWQIKRPRRKRTGYGSRFAPEFQIRIASQLFSPQSGGESTRTRLNLAVIAVTACWCVILLIIWQA